MPKNLRTYFSVEYAFWIYTLFLLIARTIEFCHSFLGISEILANYTSYLAFAYAIFCLIKSNTLNTWAEIGVSSLIILLLFLISLVIFPNTEGYFYSSSKDIFLLCFPYLYLALSIRNFTKLYNAMAQMSTILFSFAVFIVIMTFTGNIEGENVNYMTIAYDINLSVLVFGIVAISEKNYIKIILFVATTFSILIIGCRGAFITIALTTVWIIVYRYGFRLLLVPAIIILLISIFFIPTMSYVTEILDDVGYESRTLTKLLYGGLLESSGRDYIRESILAEAEMNQYMPYGLFGDRVISQKIGIGDIYIHNIFLEIIINFGIILGVILILSLVYFTIKSFIACDKKTKLIYSIIVGCAFIKLSFSNSYLIEPLFYAYLGFTIVILTNKNEKYFAHNL